MTSRLYESLVDLPDSVPSFIFRAAHELNAAADGLLNRPPPVTVVAPLSSTAPHFIDDLSALSGRCQIGEGHVSSWRRIFERNAFVFDNHEPEAYTESVGLAAIAHVPTHDGGTRPVRVRLVNDVPADLFKRPQRAVLLPAPHGQAQDRLAALFPGIFGHGNAGAVVVYRPGQPAPAPAPAAPAAEVG